MFDASEGHCYYCTVGFLSNNHVSFSQLLSQLVKLYLSFLAIRNIPLLEAMYRYMHAPAAV